MKSKLSRKEIQGKIDEFFKQKELDAKYVRKIKRLAMKHHIRLGEYRRRFCKKCFADLKNGTIRINRGYKNVMCLKCGKKDRWKIKIEGFKKD